MAQSIRLKNPKTAEVLYPVTRAENVYVGELTLDTLLARYNDTVSKQDLIYSFNEVNTHIKWIDGNDIYRRVYKITTAVTFDESIELIINAPTVANVVSLTGTLKKGTLMAGCGANVQFYYNGDNSIWVEQTFSQTFNSACEVVVIVEYVKAEQQSQ